MGYLQLPEEGLFSCVIKSEYRFCCFCWFCFLLNDQHSATLVQKAPFCQLYIFHYLAAQQISQAFYLLLLLTSPQHHHLLFVRLFTFFLFYNIPGFTRVPPPLSSFEYSSE